MSILDPLAPYIGLIKILVLAVLVGAAFIGGCRAQKGADRDRLDKAAADLRAASVELGKAHLALDASAKALREVDRQAKAAQAAAERLAKVAAEAVEGAERDAEAYADQLADVERELARAKRDPDCKQLLEVQSCAALR